MKRVGRVTSHGHHVIIAIVGINHSHYVRVRDIQIANRITGKALRVSHLTVDP
jgi:hypothetical protein